MKAVISNRIYLETTAEYGRFLEKTLTYKIPSPIDGGEPSIVKTFIKLRPGLYSIGVGRTDLIPENYEIKDKRILVPTNFPEFKFELRPTQQFIHDDIDDNAIINAKVSFGKTFTALAIAAKLGQKTLIVVHTLQLMYQWVKEVEKVFGFTPGIIGDGKLNIHDQITIGNVKSLYNNITSINKSFGLVILDEMHHASAPSFNKLIDSSYARYKIGLSGTIRRKDGMHVVFKDIFGQKLYQPPKENCMEPEINIVSSNIRFSDSIKKPWALKVNDLMADINYQNLVSVLAKVYEKKGHKVLVISDRVQFLKNIAKNTDGALITGDTQDRDLQFLKLDNKETGILCGIQAIFSEGISYDPLSCIILCTPINNEPLLEQLIGRIIRLYPDKLTPVVVDLALVGNTTQKQLNNRLGHYIRNGYKIVYL